MRSEDAKTQRADHPVTAQALGRTDQRQPQRQPPVPAIGDDQLFTSEWGALCLFAERGLDVSPAPIALVESPDPAFLLMSWLPGESLGEAELSQPQLRGIADICHDVYSITPDAIADELWPAFWNPEGRLALQRQELAKLQAQSSPTAVELTHYLQAWLDGPEPDRLLTPAPIAFSRGDPNIDNCLWTGADVNVVDFESCGWRPRAVDLAAITEHIQSRCTAHEDWEFFIEQFDLDGAERQLLRAVQRQTALRWATRECIDPGTLRSLPDAERLDILLDRVRFVCTSAF